MKDIVGLKIEAAAEILGIEATAKRWWAYARAWLYDELSGSSQAARILKPD